MALYIRKRSTWITFINGVDELREFEMAYIPNTQVCIGDLSTFTKPMFNQLLKLVESNPSISCYSSKDIADKVLLSRFPIIEKEPLNLEENHATDQFCESFKSYQDAYLYLGGFTAARKLYAVGAPKNIISILELL